MLKGLAYGFGAGILLVLALYFFWHMPAVKKSYELGKKECRGGDSIVYVKGKDSTAYKPKIVYIDTSDQQYDEQTQRYITTADFVSEDKDTIKIKVTSLDPEIRIEMIKYIKAEVMPRIDTVKIYQMKNEVIPDPTPYSAESFQPFSFTFGLGASLLFLWVMSMLTTN